jgi:hypothetical protein
MPTESATRSPYIVGPVYDWVFFLGSPLLALLAGMAIADTPFADQPFDWYGWEVTGSGLLIGAFIHAHLVLVFVRSHGNREIFRAHKLRFTLVPLALFALLAVSRPAIVVAALIATFWDVYHSGMQTFGFGRIYEAKLGNDPLAGRRLDWALNQLLYAGPIVAGATMLAHFEDFETLADIGAAAFTRVPVWMEGHQATLATLVIGGGTLFLVYYVVAAVRRQRAGQRVAWLKIVLYVGTGLTSIYTWGFNSWGEAFFIMNAFHAVQYFAIVWATEREPLLRTLGLGRSPLARAALLVVFIALPSLYGLWVAYFDPAVQVLWAITLVVSLMHFWYDGFIWSVRKRQV